MKKLFLLILSILSFQTQTIYATELNKENLIKISELQNKVIVYFNYSGEAISAPIPAEYSADFTFNDGAIHYRKLIGTNQDDDFIIQNFYISGEKLTDPYIIKNTENLNLKEFSLTPFTEKNHLEY